MIVSVVRLYGIDKVISGNERARMWEEVDMG